MIRRFLVGLLKHGKGDWRNISRNFVVSKTPTQVASHAQKYFIRQQLSGVKDKRRPSIHDITTVNFADPNLSDAPNKPASVDHRRHHHQPSNALNLFHQTTSDQMQQHMSFDWSYSKDGSFMFFDSNDANDFGFKFQGPSLYAAAPNLNPRGLVFQRYPIHG